MKKQHLQSLKLNKKTISKATIVMVKGGGHTQLWTNCVTACISCHDPR